MLRHHHRSDVRAQKHSGRHKLPAPSNQLYIHSDAKHEYRYLRYNRLFRSVSGLYAIRRYCPPVVRSGRKAIPGDIPHKHDGASQVHLWRYVLWLLLLPDRQNIHESEPGSVLFLPLSFEVVWLLPARRSSVCPPQHGILFPKPS